MVWKTLADVWQHQGWFLSVSLFLAELNLRCSLPAQLPVHLTECFQNVFIFQINSEFVYFFEVVSEFAGD